VKDDLKYALLVRKAKVLAALQFLVQHNPLYQDLAINHAMIDNWSDDFIPDDLQKNIIHLNEADHREREGYTVSLQPGNYENDLQAAQDTSFDNGGDTPLITGSVSTDINGERQDPNLRTLDYLLGVVSDRSFPLRTPLPPRIRKNCQQCAMLLEAKQHQSVTSQTLIIFRLPSQPYFQRVLEAIWTTGEFRYR